ncbi:MAG: hypothetical protein QNK89_11360 [Lacinutrix sp.]|uniref:hypothetical protein n=1 Tax=Lacinutrix sp. TaxID=1937692 RepID=UPI0030A6FF03
MTKILKLLPFFLIVFVTNANAQGYFEGEINYEITYESLNEEIPKSVFEQEMGVTANAYVKEDRYAMIYYGKGELGWMKVITRLDKGFSYTEYEKSDTIVKKELGLEKEALIEYKKNSEDKKMVFN